MFGATPAWAQGKRKCKLPNAFNILHVCFGSKETIPAVIYFCPLMFSVWIQSHEDKLFCAMTAQITPLC